MGKAWQLRDIGEESNVTDQAQSNTRHEEEKQKRQNPLSWVTNWSRREVKNDLEVKVLGAWVNGSATDPGKEVESYS